MIESYAYELFKKDGREEGLIEGLEKGLEKGKLSNLRENIVAALKLRFKNVPEETVKFVENLEDKDVLNNLFRNAITSKDFDEFNKSLI